MRIKAYTYFDGDREPTHVSGKTRTQISVPTLLFVAEVR